MSDSSSDFGGWAADSLSEMEVFEHCQEQNRYESIAIAFKEANMIGKVEVEMEL